MRWIKYTFVGLGSIIGLYFLAVAFVLLTFEDEDYRRLAASGVERFTGYTVAFDGPFLTDDIDLPVFENVQLRNIRLDVIDAAANRTTEIRLKIQTWTTCWHTPISPSS